MRTRLFLAALVLMSVSFPALAEIKMPTYPCTTLGATTMGDDRTTLVACMLTAPDSSSTGASCTLATTVGNSCAWKSMSGGGGDVSYPYYCYFSANYGTPLCPPSVTMGTQGPCSAGFTVSKDLGAWGYAGSWAGGTGGHFGWSGPIPPGGAGGASFDAGSWAIGETYICSGGASATGTASPSSVCPLGTHLVDITSGTPRCM